MENLINPRSYPAQIAADIEAMGSMAISIANRWIMGWPDRVKALINANAYLDCLESQLGQEQDMLANEANLRHLSRREILEMYEIRASPPSMLN